MSDQQLWLDYVGLGGTASPALVEGFLSGHEVPDQLQYDMLVQAINERFLDLGMDHPVPYFDELP